MPEFKKSDLLPHRLARNPAEAGYPMTEYETERPQSHTHRFERRHYPLAIAGSLLLHVVVFGLLFFGITFDFDKKPAEQARIIDAVLVESSQFDEPVEKPRSKSEVTEQHAQREEQKREEDTLREERAKQEAEQKRQEEARLQHAERKLEEDRAQQEAERKLKEEHAKQEAERKLKQEQARKKKEEDKRQEAERKKQAEKKRLDELKKQEEAAEKKRLHEQQLAEERQLEAARAKEKLASEMAVLRAQYQRAIHDKITRNWIRPVSNQAQNRCEVSISQIPGGEVVNISVRSCTGDSVFQRSVESAVHKASPLPYEGFEKVFEREIRLIFKPQE